MSRTPRRNQTSALFLLVLFGLLGVMPQPPIANATAPVTTISVTTTFDTVDGDTTSLTALQNTPGFDGKISLREAMLAAEATTGHAQLTINFALDTNDLNYDWRFTHAWEIYLDAAPTLLPQLLRGNITIDATSMRNASGQPTVMINGLAIFEPGVGQSNGFVIHSANNILRGLSLVNFYDSAVVLDGPQAVGNIIAGNSIGESLFGKPYPGYDGVIISGGASGNTIGGPTDSDRNWIVGSLSTAVDMSGTNTRDNTVAGNWIGIGMKGNVYSNAVGVSIRDGASENVIGSTLRGNLISGNTQGISLYNSNDNQVIGNLIGLGTDGQTPVANQNGGILLFGGASGNQIGGSAAGERNTIAANGGQGIYISGTGSDSNSILGNYIGVAADGSTPRGNLRQGILVAYDAHETLIGGSATGQGNVIAYNGLGGVRLDSDQNTVVGNLIGVAADGITPLGNQFNGIRVGGNENVIGPGNLIANNQIAGVVITGNQVTVQGNRLVANATAGMCVTGTHTQLIANEITANGANGPLSDECVIRAGLVMTGTQTLVQGNTILDNQAPGIVVSQGIRNRLVANSISNNQISGIALRDGGNVALAAPTITAASQTQIDGIGCANCTIEVFGDDGDQGRDLLGTTTADPQGQFHLTLARVSFRKYATATNTDANGNTSPFAQPVPLPISLFLPLVVTQ